MRRTFEGASTSSAMNDRHNPMHRRRPLRHQLMSGSARIGATFALLATLVALPLAVVALIGLPQRQALSDAFRTGRLDDTAVVQIGTLLFLLLWAWFAATAAGEIARVAAWRARPRPTPLQPLAASPTGWIRRLVRVAMISSSAVVGSGLLSVMGAPTVGSVGAASSSPASSSASAFTPASASASILLSNAIGTSSQASRPNSMQSNGRDTPYSIAVRLGDPLLRDRIIELNSGSTGQVGTTWKGGVFPVGMTIAVPEGSLDRQQRTWAPYIVVPGDSVYRIAARLSAGDGTRVRDLADEVIERNIGRAMNDGAIFDDPSLIRVGWQIEIPDESIALPAATTVDPPTIEPTSIASFDPTAHTVVRGESYWSVAEDHLIQGDQPSTGPQIAELTEAMIELNAPTLGYDIDSMIVPGDQLRWPPIEVQVPVVEPVTAPTVADPVVAAPVVAAPDAESVASLPVAAAPRDATVPRVSGDVAPTDSSTDAPTVAQSPPAGPTIAPLGQPAEQLVEPHSSGVDSGVQREAPITTSLGAAVLLCAGALGLVESRRRHQLRRAPAGARLHPPTDTDIATERLLRTLPTTGKALRLDLALRSAGHHLAGSGAHVLAVAMTDTGTITLLLHRPERATPASPWQSDIVDPSRWSLAATVETDELIDSARLAGQPCPALVHLGTVVGDGNTLAAGSSLFVDLEAFGLLSIDAGVDAGSAPLDNGHLAGTATTAIDIVRALAASLAASPVGETLRMVTHELDIDTHLGNLNAETAETIDAAIDCAAAALGSTPTAIGGRRTFELRARGVGGEAWEPVVVVSGASVHDEAAVMDLVDVSRGGGRGLAAVLIGPIDGAGLTLTAELDVWTVQPLGLQVIPVGLSAGHVSAVHALLDAADRPLAATADPFEPASPMAASFVETPWHLVVRVLGQVDVTDRDGRSVAFDRGKALELAAWLSMHRERPTRASARTALWDQQVRDATFANVVSDARRAMGRAVTPPTGEEWIERTLTEQLPLHVMVTSDAELLRARLDASRGLPVHEAIELLRPGVEWIADLPFAGTGYLWPDAEGITSALTLLATAAATELARHCLSIGDVDGVFWATGRGLRVLSGHEELIGLRMRAYAQRGDLAGVRSEWEVYERAIHADPWSSGEPSPKLVAIRRELLSH